MPEARRAHPRPRGAAALALALAGLACAPDRADPAGPPARNLLLVVVDTLRADHVGPNGYPRATTPVLDELARDSAVFTEAISHSPRTRTSMGALMTGLLPSATGLVCQDSSGECSFLPEGATTLAEVLRDAGFATRGVVSNVNVEAVFGFGQGFDEYVAASGANALASSTRAITEAGVAALEELAGEERFFLYLHYLDPHSPYEPPPRHLKEFRADSYLVGPRTGLVMSRYDAEIRYVDESLADLLAELEARGLADETAIVVVSDHGEEFNDHGGWNHGNTVYDELLHVPFVVRVPGWTDGGRVIDEQVQLVDFLPTALDVLGVRGAPETQGRSLAPLLTGAELPARPALSEAGTRPVASLRLPPWKLVVDEETDTAQLFDIERDPHEFHDVARQHPERVAELRALFDTLRAESAERASALPRTGPAAGVAPEQIEAMRALGYLEDGDS